MPRPVIPAHAARGTLVDPWNLPGQPPNARLHPPPGPRPPGHWDYAEFTDADLPLPAGYSYGRVDDVGSVLFRFEPEIDDVKQGMIGDCYLLSALHSLIRLRRADGVYGMMRENADRVLVRFYVNPANGVAYPVYVKVERTIIKKDGFLWANPAQGHLASWPHYIEKAYAFFRRYYLNALLHDSLVYKPGSNSQPITTLTHLPALPAAVHVAESRCGRDCIEVLNSGLPGSAYGHLTGTTHIRHDIWKEVPIAGGLEMLPASTYRCELLRAALDPRPPLTFARPWRECFKDFLEAAQYPTAADWRRHPLAALDAEVGALVLDIHRLKRDNYAVQRCVDLLERKIEGREEMRREEISAAFNLIGNTFNTPANQPFSDLVRNFIARSFPGKRGTGIYAAYQLDLFRNIDNATAVRPAAQTRAMFTGTGNNLGTTWSLIGAPKAREGLKKGLVPGHAYEICDKLSVPLPNAGAVARNLHFVLIRNPWLEIVRSYSWKIKDIEGQRTGVLQAAEAKQDDFSLTKIISELRGIKYIKGTGISKQIDVNSNAVVGDSQAYEPIAYGGRFAVELSDFTKYFDLVEISN